MPATNQPKGSVSTGSIKPVTRKAVRCQREVAWLVTQAAGKLVATTDDVNAPTPSFVLAAALSYTRKQEQAAQDRGTAIDYKAVMGPDLASFRAAAGLPAVPNALSDAGYMFTLSGADLIRDIYAYCRTTSQPSPPPTAKPRHKPSPKAPGREINPSPALLRSTCPRPLRASPFGCDGYSRSRCVPCSNRAPRCRSR